MIIGGLLGDGSLTMGQRALVPVYRERHGMAQEGYLQWKADVLTRLKPRLVPHMAKIGDREYPGVYLTTLANPTLQEFMDFYDGRKKIVPEKFVDELNPLGLAVWLQDDGTLCAPRGNPLYAHPTMNICSQGFTWEENEMLVERIRMMTRNYKVTVMKAQNGTRSQIYISTSALRDVAELTAPYWHPLMAYKFPYPELLASATIEE